MATVPEIVIRDRVFIPIKSVNMSDIKKKYHKSVYSHENCRRCEFLHDRHSYACDECQHFKGHFITYKEVVKNGKKYVK
jgi:adenylate cyclase class IV